MSDTPLSGACESAIFSLEQMHFAYAREGEARTVLRDVNFSLFPTQKVGLYGPNGSGKTTFFRCITGLARPQQGVIRFHGHILSAEKDFRELRCKVGFVLQHAEDQLFFSHRAGRRGLRPAQPGTHARRGAPTGFGNPGKSGARGF